VLGDPVNGTDRRGTFLDAQQCISNPDACVAEDEAEASANASGCVYMDGAPVYCNDSAPAGVDNSHPVQPQCSISLFERGVPGSWSPGIHTYLDVIDPATGLNDVLESGPSKHPKKPWGDWGNNVGHIEPVASGQFLGGTNPATNQKLASESGASVCGEISQLIADIGSYDQKPVKYSPVPKSGSGYYNSNSFTFTLLYDVGLVGAGGSGAFPSPSAWAPGWGLLIPGLQ
jgi:hypothetical protein